MAQNRYTVNKGTLNRKPAQKDWKYCEFSQYKSGAIAVKVGSQNGGYWRGYIDDKTMHQMFTKCEQIFPTSPRSGYRGTTLVVRFSKSYITNRKNL
jgi:hypothetical protein